MKEFQQSSGLLVDGVVGPITSSRDFTPYREASPTLQAGSLGPVVALLQGVLKASFGYAGAIDGIFGPATEAVVRGCSDQFRACRSPVSRTSGPGWRPPALPAQRSRAFRV